ncbi:Acylphosphatase [Corynebacterium occultum]|uniref:acylphosphatase n=1 Tax=Corynebacterium occultum TaxID=2675219 RepID=A0A6B8VQ73_9CORY|nr:Acylphosphatase [Corynebacterium occultum]
MSDQVRMTAWVHGHVQGVGFRWWTRGQAMELDLAGSAKNLVDGRVCVVAEGPRAAAEELLRRLETRPAEHHRPGTVDKVIVQWLEPKGERGFVEG